MTIVDNLPCRRLVCKYWKLLWEIDCHW